MLTEAEKLLLHVYKSQGPLDGHGRVVPFKRFAAMPLAKVNEKWDFDGLVLMHEIATVLAKRKST